ncbi:MAG: glycosyl hydrolase family 18 protein [Bacteroidota bacterium]|nr:glycosyl hydrolase family 18 protein [Bacteroidota bacterium]
MRRQLTIFIIFLFLFLSVMTHAQEASFRSVHQEQNQYYQSLGSLTIEKYDSINEFKGIIEQDSPGDCTLEKIVFGYEPYWGGSRFLNYQWNLLSDLCWFSYEVDPNTGDPITTHDWLTADPVDSAQANGVRVHLCVTLFSSHSTFFSSQQSQQTLIDNLIDLVVQRNADGVNIDFEAVPSSQAQYLMDFIVDLSTQFHQSLPESLLSIAMPAVDWNQMYDIDVLKDHVDLFIIMGYDYYWNGSSQAGPVDPLYSLTAGYDYNLSRTLSYYQTQGIPLSKMVLGLPYYARQWETVNNIVPSGTIGNGYALTYFNVKNNSNGYYDPENRYWEENSFSQYFVFNSGGWHQCFAPSVRSLSQRYDIVNLRNLAGIGIWALGYDEGYTELWDLIENKLTDCMVMPDNDTIYDSGGPSWNYYHNEDYVITIELENALSLSLHFSSFELEDEYDSLWIYDGADTSAQLIGGYSGSNGPGSVYASDNVITLRFHSDANTSKMGWEAVWNNEPYAVEETGGGSEMVLYPNPASDQVTIRCKMQDTRCRMIEVFSISGMLIERYINKSEIDVSDLPDGLYIVRLQTGNEIAMVKLVVVH